LQTAAEALEKVSENPVESTKRTAKTIELAVATGLHKAAYGVSYGVVYVGSFLAELLPKENIVRRGFVEGAEAALDARKRPTHPGGFRRNRRPPTQVPRPGPE
jgi:hypothetical protein